MNTIPPYKNAACSAKADGALKQAKGYSNMLDNEIISAAQALALARARFSNLASTGILGAKQSGPPIDLGHIDRALAFLAACRKSKTPAVHSHDLRQAIGNVSLGAVIAACVGLGFDVRSWLGTRTFAPHAMIAVNARDIR
jgi:hypothetical protein